MTIKNKDHVLSLAQERQNTIKSFGVSRLGLFGSFVHGQQDGQSDVDMLVEFQPGRKTFDNFINLAFFLESLFQRPVELVTPESLSPHIGPRILNEVEYVSIGP